jgi:hypothetical protein
VFWPFWTAGPMSSWAQARPASVTASRDAEKNLSRVFEVTPKPSPLEGDRSRVRWQTGGPVGPHFPRADAKATSFATVFMLRAVPVFATGILSFECAIPSPYVT